MKQCGCVIGVFFLMAVTFANADVYSWTDENGVRHYGNVDVSSDAKNVKKEGEIGSNRGSSSSDTASQPTGIRNNAYKGQISALAHRMQNDPEIMRLILSLQNDPEVAKILLDPELMKALRGGKVEALMANPDITKLLDNPKVKKISRQMMKDSQTPQENKAD